MTAPLRLNSNQPSLPLYNVAKNCPSNPLRVSANWQDAEKGRPAKPQPMEAPEA